MLAGCLSHTPLGFLYRVVHPAVADLQQTVDLIDIQQGDAGILSQFGLDIARHAQIHDQFLAHLGMGDLFPPDQVVGRFCPEDNPIKIGPAAQLSP